MSTHWDLKCTTCVDNDAKLGFDVNHGENECCRLWFARNYLAGLATGAAAALKALDSHGGNGFSFDFKHYRGDVDLQWFARHHGHTIVIINEYGDVLGKCMEWVRCKGCNAGSFRCALPFAHEGEHVAAQPHITQ